MHHWIRAALTVCFLGVSVVATAGETPFIVTTSPKRVADPCGAKVRTGWKRLQDGAPGRVGNLTATLRGRIVKVEGGPRVGLYNVCKNKWSFEKADYRRQPWSGFQLGDGVQWIPRRVPSQSSYHFFDGAAFELASGKRVTAGTKNAPSGRTDYVIARVGQKVIVWGGWGPIGDSYGPLGDGAVLDLRSRAWTPMAMENAPSARTDAVAAWTGQKLIVWGGSSAIGPGHSQSLLGDGAIYDLATNTWTPMNTQDAPAGRYRPMALWTGESMLIVGGGPSPVFGGASGATDAASFDPDANAWRPAAGAPALAERNWVQTFVSAGAHVLIVDTFRFSLSDYDVKKHAFVDVKMPETLADRSGVAIAWTGRRLILAGGYRQQPGWVNPCQGAHRPCDPPPPPFDVFSDAWSYAP